MTPKRFEEIKERLIELNNINPHGSSRISYDVFNELLIMTGEVVEAANCPVPPWAVPITMANELVGFIAPKAIGEVFKPGGETVSFSVSIDSLPKDVDAVYYTSAASSKVGKDET